MQKDKPRVWGMEGDEIQYRGMKSRASTLLQHMSFQVFCFQQNFHFSYITPTTLNIFKPYYS